MKFLESLPKLFRFLAEVVEVYKKHFPPQPEPEPIDPEGEDLEGDEDGEENGDGNTKPTGEAQ